MKVLILYRPNSEGARGIESFVHEFKMRHEADKLDVLDVDSRDGADIATLYGLMEFPVVLALRDDGSLLKSWSGNMLPLMDEVAYYTFSQG